MVPHNLDDASTDLLHLVRALAGVPGQWTPVSRWEMRDCALGQLGCCCVCRWWRFNGVGGAPVKESLAPEHGSELLADALEHLLDGGGVAKEGRRHLEALGWDVTHLRATRSLQGAALALELLPSLP